MEEVTATQAAELTGLSERTIRRKIAAGALPARRISANRFAIAVGDLPTRAQSHELMARLESLEHRVRLLELQLKLEDDGAAARPAIGQEEMPAPVSRELLLRLARETQRLMPLLDAVSQLEREVGATDDQEPFDIAFER
jgi:excisionase family DNA binding protein